MKLNCDMGESFGAWPMGRDSQIMPFIDQANIACGFHAGDPVVMAKTIELAKHHDNNVGAHPGYPDINGFGRRSMKLSNNELRQALHYQISALSGMAQVQGLEVHYVKPHGALYNDMMVSKDLRLSIMQAIADYPCELKLMLLATDKHEQHSNEAQSLGLKIIFEAFADRCYTDEGLLVSREKNHAVLNKPKMLQQVAQLIQHKSVTTENGNTLNFPVDSICVHGDNETAIQHIQDIRQLIDEN